MIAPITTRPSPVPEPVSQPTRALRARLSESVNGIQGKELQALVAYVQSLLDPTRPTTITPATVAKVFKAFAGNDNQLNIHEVTIFIHDYFGTEIERGKAARAIMDGKENLSQRDVVGLLRTHAALLQEWGFNFAN